MRYLDFLRDSRALAPPTYLEIGIRRGDSLTLSRSSTIGIDPDFNLKAGRPGGIGALPGDQRRILRRERPLEPFGGRPISLAFIDGMHLRSSTHCGTS